MQKELKKSRSKLFKNQLHETAQVFMEHKWKNTFTYFCNIKRKNVTIKKGDSHSRVDFFFTGKEVVCYDKRNKIVSNFYSDLVIFD